MRPPRFRLRAILASVAVIASVLGVTIEFRNYRRWTWAVRLERTERDLAGAYDRLAAKQREWGERSKARDTEEMAAEMQRDSERYGREKRRREWPWYRPLSKLEGTDR